jgi:hypothetical protein
METYALEVASIDLRRAPLSSTPAPAVTMSLRRAAVDEELQRVLAFVPPRPPFLSLPRSPDPAPMSASPSSPMSKASRSQALYSPISTVRSRHQGRWWGNNADEPLDSLPELSPSHSPSPSHSKSPRKHAKHATSSTLPSIGGGSGGGAGGGGSVLPSLEQSSPKGLSVDLTPEQYLVTTLVGSPGKPRWASMSTAALVSERGSRRNPGGLARSASSSSLPVSSSSLASPSPSHRVVCASYYGVAEGLQELAAAADAAEQRRRDAAALAVERAGAAEEAADIARLQLSRRPGSAAFRRPGSGAATAAPHDDADDSDAFSVDAEEFRIAEPADGMVTLAPLTHLLLRGNTFNARWVSAACAAVVACVCASRRAGGMSGVALL